MTQECVGDISSMNNNMLELHVGNGFLHDRDDKQPSFSNDTLLSSVQSTDFSPRSEESTSTDASSSAKNALSDQLLIVTTTTTTTDKDYTFLVEEVEQGDGNKEDNNNNMQLNNGSSLLNGNNIMTSSVTSTTSSSALQQSKFNTFTSPTKRLDSFSSNSTTKSKTTPGSAGGVVSSSNPVTAGSTPSKSPGVLNNTGDDQNADLSETSSPQKLEDRLNAVKAARERQEAERARRLAELAEALRLQQSSYEQRRAEMRRMIEERRQREEEHRRAVEERRRRLFEAEQAKRAAILRKLEEREVKIRETRIKSAHFVAAGADGVIVGGVNNATKLSGSVFCVTAQSSTAGRGLADGHRTYSIASLRRGDGARSASCDRHGAVVSGDRTSNNLLDNSVIIVSGGGLQKSPASHRLSSTTLSRSPGGPSSVVGPGIMSVSMICLSPNDKGGTSQMPPSSTAVGRQPTSTAAPGSASSNSSSSRRSRKQQAESASTASLHQIGGDSLTQTSLPSNSRMCASLFNIPEEEQLTASFGHHRIVDGNSASKRRLLASRASLLWQQTTLSRRTTAQSGGQRQTMQVSSLYSRYQPRPSSVPARPRVRRDAPTMFLGAAEAPASPVPSARGTPSSVKKHQSNNRTVAAASVRMSISFHEELSSVLANGGASEMTLTASVTAAIVPPSSASSSRTSSLRAKSERHLNRLSVAPAAAGGSDSSAGGHSKKPPTSSRQSLAPAKPMTPSTARAHPPTKPALLPSTPSKSASSAAPAAAPSSTSNGPSAAPATSDRVDATLDAEAEKEYQRKIAEKRRQAREAAAAKAAAKVAAEQSAAINTLASAGNEVTDQLTKPELTVPSSMMARSAPPDIIASALDGDGSISSTTRSTNDSPQPLQETSPLNKPSVSPESAISEPASEKLAAEQEEEESTTSTLPVVTDPYATMTKSSPSSHVVPPVIVTTEEKTPDSQQEKPVNGISSSVSDSSSIGSSSQPSSAAVSPPVSSADAESSGSKQDSPKAIRPISEDLSRQRQQLQQDVAAVRDRLSSLTGSQSNLVTAAAVRSNPAADDWAKKQEEERAERKKRLDAIMSRVKPSAAGTPASSATLTAPTLNPTGSSQSIAAPHPHLSGPIQSMPVLPSSTTTPAAPSSDSSAALTELSVGVNGSSSPYVMPSTDLILSKIKSEKVQSILANRLAASSGSKVRFNLGKEDSKEDNNGIGSIVPDLQSSSSPLPRLPSTQSSQMPATAALLMISSSTASSADDQISQTAPVANGTTNGHHHNTDDDDDRDDDSCEDRKLDQVLLLSSPEGIDPSQQQQPPPPAPTEAFVN